MREKREYILLTFQTTSEAMAMERYCGKREIPGRLIPVPGEVSAGCGLAWRIPAEEFPVYETAIRDSGILPENRVRLRL